LEELINVENLSTHYTTLGGVVRAVDNVSLKIHKGEAVALVGESGSGKSTIAFSMMRLISSPGRIINGKVALNGRDILSLSKSEMTRVRGDEMGMIFQEPLTFLNPLIRVGEQIAEAIRIHQKAIPSEAKEKAVEALRLVQLPNPETIANYYPHQLSGGMRQRVLIAIAISCRPHLLIADEPTTALDVTIQAQIMQLLHKLCKELDTALLLITHDLGLVAEYCDRVYVMYAGQIVEEADIFKLFKSPKHPYTAALLSCALMFDRRTEEFKTINGRPPGRDQLPTGCRFHPRCSQAISSCQSTVPSMVKLENGGQARCLLFEETK
jgi:peptide/nickel transport system ATP-binding protein|tara:strand:- start:689 stop:1660 length:972 start_codon:yes stop_codon:yes gene_type:complete